MNLFAFFETAICVRLTKTLVHFLWQGMAIAVLALVGAALLRRSSSRARYGAYVIALLLMAASLPLTFWMAGHPAGPSSGEITEPISSGEAPVQPWLHEAGKTVAPHAANRKSQSPGTSSLAVPQSGPSVVRAKMRRTFDWQRHAPYAAACYLIGVVLMLARLLAALQGGKRLRRAAQPLGDPTILAAAVRWAKALGLSLTPAVAYCRRIAVPTVVGVLRPTILLPLSLASGLSPEQVEMSLLHELAHIRRYDHLVNIAQGLIEVILFFHPAVWFVSRRIRMERENCCDDMVVAVGGKPVAYASSLVETAALSRQSGARRLAAATLSAGRHPSQLRHRVLRLLGPHTHEGVRLTRGWCLALATAAVVALAAAACLQSEEKITKTATTGAGTEPYSIEAKFVLDKDIPVRLVVGTKEEPDLLRFAWIRFSLAQDQLDADLRFVEVTKAAAKWRLQVQLLDNKDRVLSEAEGVYATRRLFIGFALRSEGELHYELGDRANARDAVQFAVSVVQVSGDATVTLERKSVAPPAVKPEKGEFSLEVSVVGVDGQPPQRFSLIVWRQIDPAEIRTERSAFHEELYWHDKVTGKVWMQLRSIAARSTATAENLPPGDYRVTACSGWGDDPTPVGVSPIIHLDGSKKKESVSIRLKGDSPLLVKVMDPAGGRPVSGEFVLLRREDGMPVAHTSNWSRRYLDASGTVHYSHLAPGIYSLEVGKSGWWFGMYHPESALVRTRIQVLEDKENVLEVPFTPRGTVTGDERHPMETVGAAEDQTVANAGFEPLIERIVCKAPRQDSLIDFDAGRLFRLPAYTNPDLDPEGTSAWFREQGVDAYGGTFDGVQALLGYEMIAVQTANDDFDRITPEELRNKIGQNEPASPTVKMVNERLPATFLFRTRERGKGVLQIVEIVDLSASRSGGPARSGLKIRYKMVRPTLREQLVGIDSLRAGQKTLFTRVQQTANELLARYADPADQGRILFQVAHVYAQSGQVQPEKTIEYAKKALECPLDLPDKLRLYIYWGGALWVQMRGLSSEGRAAQRRKAAEVYLTGLQEVLQYDLPAEPPELPGVGRFNLDGPPDVVRRFQEEHARQVAAREKAKRQRALIQERQVLTGQIVGLYTRKPDALNELRELVIARLGSEQAADQMVAAARARRQNPRAPLPALKSLDKKPVVPPGTEVARFEGKLEIDKEIPLGLKAGKRLVGEREHWTAELFWVKFSRSGEQIQATVRVKTSSVLEAKWRVSVELLDDEEESLARAEHVFETMFSVQHDHVQTAFGQLDFSLGPPDKLAKLTKFVVAVERAPHNADVTTDPVAAAGHVVDVTPSPEASPPTDLASFERRLEFDKKIPLPAEFGAGKRLVGDREYFAIQPDWVEFARTGKEVRANLHVKTASVQSARWRLRVHLLNEDGRVVGEDQAVIGTAVVIERYPSGEEGYLSFSLGRWSDVSKATKFGLSIEQAGSNAKETAHLNPEGPVAWGEEVNGLRAGISLELGERAYHVGETVSFVFRVANLSGDPIHLSHTSPPFLGWIPIVTDRNGRQMAVNSPIYNILAQLAERSLAPGETVILGPFGFAIRPPGWKGEIKGTTLLASPGKYRISQPYRFQASKPNDWSGELQSGSLDLDIVAAEPQPVVIRGLDLSTAPCSTRFGELRDLFEARPPGSKSYHLRDDIVRATVPPVTRGSSFPIGEVFCLPDKNVFYVQYDAAGASTLHYYGPFEGNPFERMNLPRPRLEDGNSLVPAPSPEVARVEEGLEFDRDIPLGLKVAKRVIGNRDYFAVELNSVRFVKNEDRVQASLRVKSTTILDAKWRARVELLAVDGRVLAHSEAVLATLLRILGRPGFDRGYLHFSLGRWSEVSEGTKFRISIQRAPDDAEVTAHLAS